MIDGGLRKIFHGKLRGIHWQAIETGGTGRGIPDSNYCAPRPDGNGTEGWVEFKSTEGWAVDLSPDQIGWILRRIRMGGTVWIAVRRKHTGGPRKGDPVDELWILPGRLAKEAKELGLRGIKEDCAVLSSGGQSAWDWDEIRRVLTWEKP